MHYRWNIKRLLIVLVLAGGFGGCASVMDERQSLLDDGVVLYETEVIVDPASQTLNVSTELQLLVTEESASTIEFVLNGALDLQLVNGCDVYGHRAEVFQPVPVWDVIEIEFIDSVAPGDVVSLRFDYSGGLDFDEAQFQYAGMLTPDWVDLNIDSMWHPVVAGFDRQMRGRMRLSFPEGWQVVGSGKTEFEDGQYRIRNETPISDVPFAAAPAMKSMKAGALEVHYQDASAERVEAVFETAIHCFEYLNGRFGQVDPMKTARLVIADREGGGYARRNYIVLSAEEIEPDKPVGLHRFVCHELAHYWTPTPGGMSPDHWMSEAFAEFVAGRFLGAHFGEEAYGEKLDRWKSGGQGHGPVWTPDLKERPSYETMYWRAPWLLHQLGSKIGTEALDIFIRRYMTEDILRTKHLLDELESIAGREVAQWFKGELSRDDW